MSVNQGHHATARLNAATTALLVGFVIGMRNIGFALAVAAVLFAGPLAEGIPIAARAALIGSVLVAVLFGLASRVPGNIGLVQDMGPAILAPALAATAGMMTMPQTAGVATALAIVALASATTGLLIWGVGRFRLGRIVRFFPQTVLAGFIAGTGVLLIIGSLSVAMGLPGATLFARDAWSSDAALRGAATLALGLLMLLLQTRFRAPPWTILAVLVAATAGFHLVLLALGTGIEAATGAGWLNALAPPVDPAALRAMPAMVDRAVLAQALPAIGVVAALCLVAAMMNLSVLDTMTGANADPNRELRLTGLANLGAACVASPPVYSGLAASIFAWRMSKAHRASLLALLAVTLGGLFAARWLIDVVPVFVTSGLLVYLAFEILREWIWAARHRFERLDKVLILGIVLLFALVGAGTALMVGMVAAVVLFVLRYSTLPVLARVSTLATQRSSLERDPEQTETLRRTGDAAIVAELQGYLFFGSADRLRHFLAHRIAAGDLPRLRAAIFDFGRVTGSDSSALVLVAQVIDRAADHGARVVLSGLSAGLRERLERAMPKSLERATRVASLDEALELAEDHLLGPQSVVMPPPRFAALYTARPDDAARLEVFLASVPLETVLAGQTILAEGVPADGVVLLESGRASVHRRSGETGGQGRLAGIAAGAILGDIGHALDRARSAEVRAETEVTLRRLTEERIERIRKTDAELSQIIERMIAKALALKLLTSDRLREVGGR